MKAGVWNHLKAHSLPCLVVGPQQGLQLELSTPGLFIWLLGLPHNMVAQFQGHMSREEQRGVRQKPYNLLQSCLKVK